MQSQYLFQMLLNKLLEGWIALPDKPAETPRTTLETLWRITVGTESWHTSEDVNPELTQRLQVLIQKRLQKEPLAYLSGRQTFMGIEFLSSPEAMIPRKETEILGKAVVGLANQLSEELGAIRIIDLCTGSGNIALTLAHREPRCVVYGADISEDAVHLARQNAEYLGLSDRVRFYSGDLFAPFEQKEFLGQMDMITCNPPYISSAQVKRLPDEIVLYEPRLAFDGGPFGIRIMTRLIREAPRFLKPHGLVCFEVGLGQGKVILDLMNRNGLYTNIEAFTDEAGEYRAMKGKVIEHN